MTETTDHTAVRLECTEELLTGWGRTRPTRASVARPSTVDDFADILATPASRGIIARGLGRSYGDQAQNAGGIVMMMTGIEQVHSLDVDARVVTVDAGVSLDHLIRFLVPFGLFIPVSPGTRFVTVGGAIAADIHGKNHHVDGTFCQHVIGFTLHTPVGTVRVDPSSEHDLFWATAGGLGLTGVIGRVCLRLQSIETATMTVDTERTRDIDDVLARMEADDDRYQYSVAWIDSAARGASLGRSVLTRAQHTRLEELPPSGRTCALRLPEGHAFSAPAWLPPGLINQQSVRIFNKVWYRKAPRREHGRLQSMLAFFHPLDGVRNWNGLYGQRGFLQYQMVVPFGAEEILRMVLERLSSYGSSSAVTVLKRFGPSNPGLLSFPMPGWTLALDLPVGRPELGSLLDRLDDLVVAAGGRLYLAKDSRVRAELVPLMYPRIDEWNRVRARVDPRGALQSDTARRLSLSRGRPR